MITRLPRPRWRPRFTLRTMLLASFLIGSVALLYLHREPWQLRMTIHETDFIQSAGYSTNDKYITVQTESTRNLRSSERQIVFKVYDRDSGRLVSSYASLRGLRMRGSIGEKYVITDGLITMLSPDSRQQLFRADTGEPVEILGDVPDHYTLSPGENFAALGFKKKFRLVKLPSLETIVPEGEESAMIHGFSPDEKWLAVSSINADKLVVRLIATTPGVPEKRFPTDLSLSHRFYFSPDSKTFALSDGIQSTTAIYDIASSDLITRVVGRFAMFSTDSKRVLTFSNDLESDQKVWLYPIDTTAQKIQFTSNSVHDIRVLEDRFLNSAPFGAFDIDTGAKTNFYTDGKGHFSKDGRFGVFYLGNIFRYYLCNASGTILHTFEKQKTDEIFFKLEFANEHAECIVYRFDDGRERYFEIGSGGAIDYPKPDHEIPSKNVQIWSQRRPEFWWGYPWLWEFWLVIVLAVALVWSLVQPIVRPGAPTR